MANKKPLILIADDEPAICTILKIQFSQKDFEVVTASDGDEALAMFEKHHPSLVVLDIMMPVLNGWEVLREIRRRSDVPVLVLTALSGDSDQLTGFDAGADDFVVKPFSASQISARVRAILRRMCQEHDRLSFGPITVDVTAHQVMVDGRPVALTGREFALLEALVRNPGRAFSRAELLSRCWEPTFNGVDRVVDVHMTSLRRKLGRDQNYISTVRGVGYRLSAS